MMKQPKFMQTLDDGVFDKLKEEADMRNISVQLLLRAVIIPNYLLKSNGSNHGPLTSASLYEDNQQQALSENSEGQIKNSNVQQYQAIDKNGEDPSNTYSNPTPEEAALVRSYQLFGKPNEKTAQLQSRKHDFDSIQIKVPSPASYSEKIRTKNSKAREHPVYQEFSKIIAGNSSPSEL